MTITATTSDALPSLAAGPHRRTFDRLVQLFDASPSTQESSWRTDVLTATFGVFARGAAPDFERTAMLARVDRQRLIRILSSFDDLVGTGASRPIETTTILTLGRTAHIERVLRAAGHSELDAELIASDCATVGFWLLMEGVDAAAPAPLPRTSAELLAITERQGVTAWRRVLAILATSPWSPDAHRLAELAHQTGSAEVARVIEVCARVCRHRSEDEERQAVAQEVRRLVATSGCNQREFAAQMGTSASRLSTYVNGNTTPSATMMLRMHHVATHLARRAQV